METKGIKISKNNGITLIALIITVIVLIILAGITINMVVGNDGIINKAKEAKTNQENAQMEELNALNRLEEEMQDLIDGDNLEKGISFGDIVWSGGKASVKIEIKEGYDQKYEAEYQINTKEDQWTKGTDVSNLNNGDKVYARLTDGKKIGKEIETTIEDKTPPQITIQEQSSTSNSINLKIEVVDNEYGMPDTPTYTYSIKKQTEEDSAYAQIQSNSEKTCKAEGLLQDTGYVIKIQTEDKAGNKAEATVEIRTSNNTAPTMPTVTLQSKTPSALNFQATSTDENNDSLIYKLYMRQKDTGEYEVKDTKEANAGTAVTLSATSLGNYTEYDYYVEVTDNKDAPINTANAVERTQCSGTTINCTTGSTGTTCPGPARPCRCTKTDSYFDEGDEGWQNAWCNWCNHKCGQHGSRGCEAIKCEHGYISSHTYGQRTCPHGRQQQHWYCEHSQSGVPHN